MKAPTRPFCPQSADEAAACTLIDYAWQTFGPSLYTREVPLCHFTSSSMIFDRTLSRALMVYHNLYQSWSWTGGHNDGDPDFLSVALREAREETGVSATPLSLQPLRWDVLPVAAHEKRGRSVAAHLHLNAAFALVADDQAPLTVCPSENSAVAWLDLDELPARCEEPAMVPLYLSMAERARSLAR